MVTEFLFTNRCTASSFCFNLLIASRVFISIISFLCDLYLVPRALLLITSPKSLRNFSGTRHTLLDVLRSLQTKIKHGISWTKQIQQKMYILGQHTQTSFHAITSNLNNRPHNQWEIENGGLPPDLMHRQGIQIFWLVDLSQIKRWIFVVFKRSRFSTAMNFVHPGVLNRVLFPES